MSTRWLSRLLITASIAGLLAASGCSPQPEAAVETQPAETQTQPQTEAQPESPATESEAEQPAEAEQVTELKIEDVKKGKGDPIKAGQTAVVHYTGWLTDGTKFDSSKDSGQPFPFTLGAGQVIAGWDQGVEGMKVGGVRKLTIPSDLAYGPGGTPDGTIPPNATLVFEVELLEIQ